MSVTELAVPGIETDTRVERLPERYTTWSATEKLTFLWEQRLLATESSTFPPFESRSMRFGKKYLDQSFDHVSDQMPPGHVRVLHLRGSVACAGWEAAPDCPYTGLFQGATQVLVRLSLGAPPKWPVGFVPGMGIKLLVDGGPSANLHVMNSVDGQGANHDFFALPFSNRLPPAKGWLTWFGAQLFKRVKSDPFDLPVDHLARVSANGGVVERPSWPHQLHFLPAVVNGGGEPLPGHDFRADLARIPVDTVLYNVHASAAPGAPAMPIGRIVTRSRFVSSLWGDEQLFLQHNR